MSINYKVYQKLAQTADARLTCIKRNNNEWNDKHTEAIENIIKKYLPSGSGIDNGNKFNFDKSNSERLVINAAYHVMNENGYYMEWIDYTVTIKAHLFLEIDINIIGNFGKHQDIKDYLYDVYREALTQTITE